MKDKTEKKDQNKISQVVPKERAKTMHHQSKTAKKKADVKKQIKPKQKKGKIKRKKGKYAFWIKDIVLALLNIGFVVALVLLQTKLSERATQLRTLKNEELKTTTKGEIDISEIELENSRKKAEKLLDFFPDEAGLIDFVNEIDVFKSEGVVSKFSFASEKAVRDKTGYYGVPLVIEFAGTWNEIGGALDRLEKLPYLIRVVNVEIVPQEGSDLVVFKYGGFLYVKENFAEN